MQLPTRVYLTPPNFLLQTRCKPGYVLQELHHLYKITHMARAKDNKPCVYVHDYTVPPGVLVTV